MILIKKLTFAPIFLVIFALLSYQLNPLLKSSDFIFSLSLTTLIQLIIVSVLFTLSGFLFVVFATLAQDWKLTLPVGVVASIFAFIFTDQSLALIFVVAILASVLLTIIILSSTLGSYLNFQPGKVINPSVKLLSTLLVASFCVVYFLSMNKIISQNGFQIPDSLIDTALKMSPVQEQNIQIPNIPPEQLELLKKNPDLVKQYGLDPKILDTLSKPQTGNPPQDLTNELIKQTVKDQLQNIIKPYISFVPIALAILLFLTLQFFTSIINIFISPLLALTFYFLEKTGYTRYEIEKREVKKLVV